ncbi:hypothetical protein ACIHFD_67065 [Nonomuraea sp. NPDC051941]|uniref:hypothetical protein n=1 Tax=Nonomuraea sp. NPDC051941 TaxID=3364373 RepID=UPI0037C8AA8E
MLQVAVMFTSGIHHLRGDICICSPGRPEDKADFIGDAKIQTSRRAGGRGRSGRRDVAITGGGATVNQPHQGGSSELRLHLAAPT